MNVSCPSYRYSMLLLLYYEFASFCNGRYPPTHFLGMCWDYTFTITLDLVAHGDAIYIKIEIEL